MPWLTSETNESHALSHQHGIQRPGPRVCAGAPLTCASFGRRSTGKTIPRTETHRTTRGPVAP